MKSNKFPFRYFLILFLMLLLAILFWTIVFGFNKNSNNNNQSNIQRIVERVFIDKPNTEDEYWHQDYLPEHAAQIIPIDTTKIINDTLNQRRIVSNLVNIAIKNTSNSIAKFANDLKEKYPSDEYKIVYIDSVVNRLQVQLPDKDRVNFKTEVKAKLNQYKLLVWDETLFDYVKTFNDPKLKDNSANCF